MKTIVEFFGEPGVGKSYVADRLHEQVFEAVGSRAVMGGGPAISRLSNRAWIKARIVATTACRYPFLSVRVLFFVLAYGVRHPVAIFRVWSNFFFLLGHIRMTQQHADTIILDQGFSQALWSTIVRGGKHLNGPIASRLFLNLARSSGVDRIVIVWVDAPESFHRERLRERRALGRQPSADLMSSRSSKSWSHATAAVNEVISRCASYIRNPWIEHVRCMNDADDFQLSEVCKAVAGAVCDDQPIDAFLDLAFSVDANVSDAEVMQ